MTHKYIDQLPVEQDKVSIYKSPAGDIKSDAIIAADKFLDKVIPSEKYPRLSDLSKLSQDWTKWMVTSGQFAGTFVKRYQNYMFKVLGFKDYDPVVVAKLGEIISARCDVGEVYYFDIVRSCEWNPGQFGERENSCWWKEYSDSRIGLFENGGLSLRFFDETSLSLNLKQRTHGIGRCWLFPYNDDTFLIFNAYHKRMVSLLLMARMMSTILGTLYYDAKIKVPDAYVNGDKGYRIGDTEAQVYCVEFVDTSKIMCANCGVSFTEDYITYVGDDPICDECLSDHYFWCEDCEEYFERSSDYHIVRGKWFCNDCYGSKYFSCDECDNDTDNDECNEDGDGHEYCNECYLELFDTCPGCSNDYRKRDMTESYRGELYCANCAREMSICPDCILLYDDEGDKCPDCLELDARHALEAHNEN
jgi:hypothetical protein